MADRRRPADQRIIEPHGLDDVEIGQMRPALIGVVEDEDIARSDRRAKFSGDAAHRIGDRAEMQRQSHALGDEPALRVAQRAAHIHRILQIIGVGGTHERDRHLVDDRINSMLEEFEQYRLAELASVHVSLRS